ncbi:hypothetical protein CKAN_02017300 [Cinnamomum micranthum f. kanehirae]|uniref:Uncharacterized protein n=1 Tax=Cinnamomum micranthum f. kanehirae TaxID=337451 RepID=A0A3S3QWZ7_9MAGN|nr:hypothetical protein CKAN_02017300 [Cinnamomum micranthum f. kanehirae]
MGSGDGEYKKIREDRDSLCYKEIEKENLEETISVKVLPEMKRFHDKSEILAQFSNALVNGSLHWASYNCLERRMRITSLGMSDEQLGLVPTPVKECVN